MAKVRQYRVEWVIDIWATTPRKAAEEARKAQRSRGSLATVFDVKEYDSEADAIRIDLSETEKKPALQSDMPAYEAYFDRMESALKRPLSFEEWQKAGRP